MGGVGALGEDAIGALGAGGAVATATAGTTGVLSPLTSTKVPKMPTVIIEMSVFAFTPFNYPKMRETVSSHFLIYLWGLCLCLLLAV